MNYPVLVLPNKPRNLRLQTYQQRYSTLSTYLSSPGRPEVVHKAARLRRCEIGKARLKNGG